MRKPNRYAIRAGAMFALSVTLIALPAAFARAEEGASAKFMVPKQVSDTPMEAVASISNFFSQPENKFKIQFPSNETRFVWQNFSRFYPTAQVLRDGLIGPLPKSLNPKIASVSAVIDGKLATLDHHLNVHPVDAFMVVQKGKIVFERYNTMRPIDKHIWFSSGKVVGAALLAMLEEEGRVDLNKPVSFYIHELKGSVWETVTVKETVDMATGLDSTEHDEPNHDSRTNPEQGWFKWAASLGLAPAASNAGPWEVLRSMARRRDGLQAFEYNSINTFVMNRVVERVSSLPLNELFTRRIWSKIGAQADAYVVTSPQGYALHFFGVNSSLADFARFGMAFTQSGGYLVPKSVVSKIQKAGRPEIFGAGLVGQQMIWSFPGERLRNAYQWDAIFDDGDLYKAGVGGQGLYVSPGRDTVVVWFGTGTGRNREETFAREIAKFLKSKN